MNGKFQVGGRWVGNEHPTYFIADIAANHDGDVERAKKLIRLAAEAGVDAVKFQHFEAATLVSDYGFKALGQQGTHQAQWEKSVFDMYEVASVPADWAHELKQVSDEVGVHFFSTPYSLAAVELLDSVEVLAHKIGSGDITWPEIIRRVGKSGKPVFIATGASDLEDVKRAMDVLMAENSQICLMQCNTNYTGSAENFAHIHLKVIETYAQTWPGVVTGLSDHTLGHTTTLGAVALGARAIEKHFTDDRNRAGSDHPFSMEPGEWREMIDRTRELEAALGHNRKVVAENEMETIVVQRRCLRTKTALQSGTILQSGHFLPLRPAPIGAVLPYELENISGRTLNRNLEAGQHFTLNDVT
jgi:N-acetylneuraminate synthase